MWRYAAEVLPLPVDLRCSCSSRLSPFGRSCSNRISTLLLASRSTSPFSDFQPLALSLCSKSAGVSNFRVVLVVPSNMCLLGHADYTAQGQSTGPVQAVHLLEVSLQSWCWGDDYATIKQFAICLTSKEFPGGLTPTDPQRSFVFTLNLGVPLRRGSEWGFLRTHRV